MTVSNSRAINIAVTKARLNLQLAAVALNEITTFNGPFATKLIEIDEKILAIIDMLHDL